MDVRQFVERELPVGLQLRHRAMMTWLLEPAHAQMSRHAWNGLTNPPAPGQHLQSCKRETPEQAVLERLVHVLHGPHFGPDPALTNLFVERDEPRFGRIAGEDRVERGLCRKHARL